MSPGNALSPAKSTNLPKDSVANASQIITIDKQLSSERVGRLTGAKLQLVLSGPDVVLGR